VGIEPSRDKRRQKDAGDWSDWIAHVSPLRGDRVGVNDVTPLTLRFSFVTVCALAGKYSPTYEMHAPVLAEASTDLQTQSADVCSMDPTTDTRGPQASRHSHLDVIVLGRAHIRHCQRFPDMSEGASSCPN